MRDPKRIDKITQLLNEIWHEYPDLRFWQLLSVIPMGKATNTPDLFFVEDDKIIEVLKEVIEEGL